MIIICFDEFHMCSGRGEINKEGLFCGGTCSVYDDRICCYFCDRKCNLRVMNDLVMDPVRRLKILSKVLLIKEKLKDNLEVV